MQGVAKPHLVINFIHCGFPLLLNWMRPSGIRLNRNVACIDDSIDAMTPTLGPPMQKTSTKRELAIFPTI